jgi:hypothetical protein
MAISAVNLLWLIDPHDLQGMTAPKGTNSEYSRRDCHQLKDEIIRFH